MIKAVLMDVGKTIVNNRVIDFGRALKAVYDLDERDSKCELEEYGRVFNELYNVTFGVARVINTEVKIGDFLVALNNITGIKLPDKYQDQDELEWFFQCKLIDDDLIDGVKDFLEYCKNNKLPVIAVSNSCMTCTPMKRELKELGVWDYFIDLISSADILYRKPRKEIFDYAYGKLLKIDDTITRDEVLFIGDNFDCDIVGSLNAGFQAAWLNWKHENKQDSGLMFFDVQSYKELISLLNSTFKK